ncbi:MAG: DUF423 domain-containing protein [Pseudomonadales bacterium]|jgi:uncharacterized membrane protein YgdD (TMEM256/DUF423 family)
MSMKIFLVFSGLSGFVSVAMGAFAAHALRGKIEDKLFHAFETAVNYQMTHTLALLGVCILMQLWGVKPALQLAGIGFALGIVLFSGSLYGLALTGAKWLGPITPIGGLAFLFAWACLTYAAWQHTS